MLGYNKKLLEYEFPFNDIQKNNLFFIKLSVYLCII